MASYALSARRNDQIPTRYAARTLLLQHDLRKALNRFSLESKTEQLLNLICANTPFSDYQYLGHGSFKEAYALDDHFVIKTCSQHNSTTAERTLLEIAEEEGFGNVFIPTAFASLHGFYVDMPHIVEDETDGGWLYDESNNTWVEDREWEGIFATDVEIQPRIDNVAVEPTWNYMAKGEILVHPETAEVVDPDLIWSLGIAAKQWLERFIMYYGIPMLQRLTDFVNKYHIIDLHNGNLGYLSGRPIIIDWESGF